jgi:hypothetical protein
MLVATDTLSTSTGKELQDAVRAGAVIHPLGVWGANDETVGKSGR